MTAISNPAMVSAAFRYGIDDPAGLRLGSEEVHLWLGNVKTSSCDREAMLKTLSRDEQERRLRFRFPEDQANFLFARSMLRIVLASYLDAGPAAVNFSYSAHGKPSLPGSPSGGLQFNLSHSGDLVLLAVCRDRRIGVDIEKVRRDIEAREIAENYFSAAEREALSHFAGPSLHDAFFSCWTRKEAFVKARGEGLSCPLNCFDVPVDPEEQDMEIQTRPDAAEASRWNLRSLKLAPGYAAALAIEVRDE
jgi:4'-phosphopantetheinyl transferase